MIEQKTVPSVRFKGFTDDWKQCKVSSVAEIIGGGTPSTNNPEYWDGDIDWYAPAEINESPYVFGSERKITKLGLEKSSAKILPAYKTVLFTSRAGIGKTTILGKPGATNQGFQSMVLNEDANAYFVYSMTEMIKKKAEKIASGSTFAEISGKMLGNLEFLFPNRIEQNTIATFFEILDNRIILQQRKYDKLLNVKRAMLEKLFPKEEETVPKVRFKGFTDDWKQHKLGEVYQKIGNAFVGTATPYYTEIGHFYLESNNVKDGQINHYTEVFINDEFYEKQKDKWLHEGDMVMVQSGHVGHAAVIPKELNNTAAHALIMFKKPMIKVEPYFLNYQYQTLKAKKQIDNITVGNTVKHILASDMQNFVVDFPNHDEQKKVAVFFRRLDNLITLQKHKIEKLKNIKKSMLEKMFV